MKETKLLPDAGNGPSTDGTEDDDVEDADVAAALAASKQSPTPTTFGLTTDLFFLAHACFQIGFNVIAKSFLEMNQEMHQLQSAFRASLAGGGTIPELKDRLETLMSRYLSIQAALLEPGVVQGADGLLGATMSWVNRLATIENENDASGDAASFKEITFPLSPNRSSTSPLRHVPEMVVNNVVEFVLFTHRFNRSAFANMAQSLDELLTFIVIFMGDKTRMKNPHLKAQLAELLETTLPVKDDAGRRGRYLILLESVELQF